MNNSHYSNQQSQLFNSNSLSGNPEVNEIIRRHEEIANNIKKIRSSSQIPPSYVRSSYNPVGSYQNIASDNDSETIITTTTMTVTPNVLRNSYAPQQNYRGNNFLNNSQYQTSNGSDLVSQLKKANQNILNISQDIRDFNDNVKRSQVIGNNSGLNYPQYSNYNNNNNPIVSPITRRNEQQPFSSSYLSVGNSQVNPRSASVYSSRYIQPQTNNYQQSLYPSTRGASQKRVTEIVTTTYENDIPSVPLAQFNKSNNNNSSNNNNNNNNNNNIKGYNSKSYLPYSQGNIQSNIQNNGTSNNISSLSRLPDAQEHDDEYVRRIYVKGDGFEYEEIIDEEDPQNNYKALRDAYHDEWQRIDYTPDFVLPFLEIQKQSKIATSMSQINMSQVSPINEPVKYDYKQNNHLSRNFLDNSYAETSANVTNSYIKEFPTVRSYIA